MRLPVLASVLALCLVAKGAGALVWPDVPEKIEHDLASSDPAVRAAAAEKLDALGPARATPLVLRALGDTDVNVRLAAAETATRARTPGATATVLSWLGEHDGRLRAAACSVAEAVPDGRAVPLLARALSDADSVVRSRAIQALGAQQAPGSKDAVAPLLGKLDDPSPPVRVELARALARLGDPRAVVPLIGKVEDSVPEVREAVAQALGDLGDARAAAAIVLQLRDVSPEVRVVALAALAKVRGAETVDSIGPLATDRNPTVRHAALATLGALAKAGSGEALRILVGRLGTDEDATAELDASPVRDALVDAGDAAVPSLRGLLAQKGGASTAAATSAAWVLGTLRATAASPDLVSALRHGTLPALAALHALGAAGTPDELPVVLEFVGADSSPVRGEALAAARALLDPEHPDGRAVEPLLAALAKATRLPASDVARVIDLLGRTGATRASQALTGFARSRDRGVKLAAIDALATLGPTGDDEPLLALVTDPAPDVRLRAADALAATGGARARDALLRMLRSGPELDRVAALAALRGVLVRAPSDAAFRQLEDELSVVVGAERDAVLLVLARAAPVHPVVARLLASKDADDRRTVLAGSAGRADTASLARARLGDDDPSVRAEAAWSLGATAAGESLADLDRVAKDRDVRLRDAAVDAAGAIARIAERAHGGPAITTLCGLVTDPRPLVRANVLVGLSLAGARCGSGDVERAALSDPSPSVRAAAARAVAATSRGPEDAAALARCASHERSVEVAPLCASARPPTKPGRPHDVLVYVEGPPHAEPGARIPYVLELGDGLLRAGTADRRGALFEAEAPPGMMRLRDVTAPEPQITGSR